MKPPDRLPTSVKDLDEWSVYADFLQTRGDSRGERIAYELALPVEPESAALRVFHTLVRDAGRFPVGVQVAISLGHVRALVLRASPGPRLSHRVYGPLDGTLAWVRDFFLDPKAALIEELRFVYVPGEHVSQWKRLFAALPDRCSRVGVFLRPPIGRCWTGSGGTVCSRFGRSSRGRSPRATRSALERTTSFESASVAAISCAAATDGRCEATTSARFGRTECSSRPMPSSRSWTVIASASTEARANGSSARATVVLFDSYVN